MVHDKIVKIWSDDEYINIRISHNDLFELAEKHPTTPYKVVKLSQFIKEYVHELENGLGGYEADSNRIEKVIEDVIQSLGDNGSETIKEIKWYEE